MIILVIFMNDDYDEEEFQEEPQPLVIELTKLQNAIIKNIKQVTYKDEAQIARFKWAISFLGYKKTEELYNKWNKDSKRTFQSILEMESKCFVNLNIDNRKEFISIEIYEYDSRDNPISKFILIDSD